MLADELELTSSDVVLRLDQSGFGRSRVISRSWASGVIRLQSSRCFTCCWCLPHAGGDKGEGRPGVDPAARPRSGSGSTVGSQATTMTSIGDDGTDSAGNERIGCWAGVIGVVSGIWSTLNLMARKFMLPWGVTALTLFTIAVVAVELDPAVYFQLDDSQRAGNGFVVPIVTNGTAVPQDASLQLADTHLGAWALFLSISIIIVPPLQLVSNLASRLLAALAPSSWPAFRLYVVTVQGPAWRVGWTAIFPSLWTWVLGSTTAGSIRIRLAVVLGVASVFEGVISLSLRIFRQTSHLAAFQVKVDALQTRIRSLQAFSLLAAAVESSRRRFRHLYTSRAVFIAVERAKGPNTELPSVPPANLGPPTVPIRAPASSAAAAALKPVLEEGPASATSLKVSESGRTVPAHGGGDGNSVGHADEEHGTSEEPGESLPPGPAGPGSQNEDAPAGVPVSSTGIEVAVHSGLGPRSAARAVRFGAGEVGPTCHGRSRLPITAELLTMVRICAAAPALRSIMAFGTARGSVVSGTTRGLGAERLRFVPGDAGQGKQPHHGGGGSWSPRPPASGARARREEAEAAAAAYSARAAKVAGPGRLQGSRHGGSSAAEGAARGGDVASEGGGSTGDQPKETGRRRSMLGLARMAGSWRGGEDRADSEGAAEDDVTESAPIRRVGASARRAASALAGEHSGTAGEAASTPVPGFAAGDSSGVASDQPRRAPGGASSAQFGNHAARPPEPPRAGGRQAQTEIHVTPKPHGRLPWAPSGAVRDDNGMASVAGRTRTHAGRASEADPAAVAAVGGQPANSSGRWRLLPQHGAAGRDWSASHPAPMEGSGSRWMGVSGAWGQGRSAAPFPSASQVASVRKPEFQFVPRTTAMRWGEVSIADMVGVVLQGGDGTDAAYADAATRKQEGDGDEAANGLAANTSQAADVAATSAGGTVAAATGPKPGQEDTLGELTGVEVAGVRSAGSDVASRSKRQLAVAAAEALGLRLDDQAAVAAKAAVAAAGGGFDPSDIAGLRPAKSANSARLAYRRGSPSAAALGVWGALTGSASSAVPLFAAHPPPITAEKRTSRGRGNSSAVDLQGAGDSTSLPAPRLNDVASTAEARRLLTESFDQLDYQRCKRISVASLCDRLDLPRPVAQALLSAVAGITTEAVSRRDVAAAAASIIRDVRALGHTVEDFGALTTALRLAAMAVWGVLVVFVGLWAFEVSLLDVIVPLGLLFTSLSFAAGEPARIFFLGLFALTVYAPFEVGDRVSINGSRVATVTKIEVCATWLRNVHGKSFMISNHTLINSVVENFRRCNKAGVEQIFTVGYRTTARQFDALLEAALAHVRSLPNRWDDSVSCYIKDGSGVDGVINFVLWLDHKHSWMEAAEVLTDSSRFTFFIIQTMRKLGIEHIKSPQPIIHVDPMAGSGPDAPQASRPEGVEKTDTAHRQSLHPPSCASLPRSDGWRMQAGTSLIARDWSERPSPPAHHPMSRVPRPLLPSEFMSDVLSRGYNGRIWASMFEPPHLGAVSKVVGETSYDERLASTLRRRLPAPAPRAED